MEKNYLKAEKQLIRVWKCSRFFDENNCVYKIICGVGIHTF